MFFSRGSVRGISVVFAACFGMSAWGQQQQAKCPQLKEVVGEGDSCKKIFQKVEDLAKKVKDDTEGVDLTEAKKEAKKKTGEVSQAMQGCIEGSNTEVATIVKEIDEALKSISSNEEKSGQDSVLAAGASLKVANAEAPGSAAALKAAGEAKDSASNAHTSFLSCQSKAGTQAQRAQYSKTIPTQLRAELKSALDTCKPQQVNATAAMIHKIEEQVGQGNNAAQNQENSLDEKSKESNALKKSCLEKNDTVNGVDSGLDSVEKHFTEKKGDTPADKSPGGGEKSGGSGSKEGGGSPKTPEKQAEEKAAKEKAEKDKKQQDSCVDPQTGERKQTPECQLMQAQPYHPYDPYYPQPTPTTDPNQGKGEQGKGEQPQQGGGQGGGDQGKGEGKGEEKPAKKTDSDGKCTNPTDTPNGDGTCCPQGTTKNPGQQTCSKPGANPTLPGGGVAPPPNNGNGFSGCEAGRTLFQGSTCCERVENNQCLYKNGNPAVGTPVVVNKIQPKSMSTSRILPTIALCEKAKNDGTSEPEGCARVRAAIRTKAQVETLTTPRSKKLRK